MESILNVGWALLAIVFVCLWLRLGCCDRADRRTQLVALAVLILILLPVISVTDDLQAIQNPAETDTCQRRSYVAAIAHSTFPAIAALPSPVFAESPFVFLRFAVPGNRLDPVVESPAWAAVQNRPPPAV